jgi:putative intracellular protease/amidase
VEANVTLYPALKVEPQATIVEFDAQHPKGADYVIVPSMSRDDDPAALEWIRSQAAKGAIVIGVCAGAKVVGAAGLLDGKRQAATTHWYYLKEPVRVDGDRQPVWKQEQLGIELTPGVDEVSLALVADAWSRTYRSRAVTLAGTTGALETRNGIRIIPDRVATNWST